MNLINRDQFKDLLQKGPISFSYTKIDGSVREAHGTLDPSIIEQYVPPKLNEGNDFQNHVKSSLTYFDLDLKEFRSIHKMSEIYI